LKSIRDEINLFFISDIHHAQDASNESLLIEDLKDKPQNRFILGVGDEVDSISRADHRHKLEDLKEKFTTKKVYPHLITAEVNDLSNIYSKYTTPDEWLGHCSGNHPLILTEQTQIDPVMMMCDKLNHRYLGYSAFVPLSIDPGNHRRVSCMIMCHHGFGGGGARKEGSGVNAYVDHALRFEGWDIAVYGHRHDRWVRTIPRIAPQGAGYSVRSPWVRAVDRIVTQCGTYLRTLSHAEYPTYAERAGYPPRPIGCVKLKIGIKRDGSHHQDHQTLKVISSNV
jgi:predicted phosphodiesterase